MDINTIIEEELFNSYGGVVASISFEMIYFHIIT